MLRPRSRVQRSAAPPRRSPGGASDATEAWRSTGNETEAHHQSPTAAAGQNVPKTESTNRCSHRRVGGSPDSSRRAECPDHSPWWFQPIESVSEIAECCHRAVEVAEGPGKGDLREQPPTILRCLVEDGGAGGRPPDVRTSAASGRRLTQRSRVQLAVEREIERPLRPRARNARNSTQRVSRSARLTRRRSGRGGAWRT